MSIKNLFSENDYDIKCKSIETYSIITDSINTNNIITNTLTIDELLASTYLFPPYNNPTNALNQYYDIVSYDMPLSQFVYGIFSNNANIYFNKIGRIVSLSIVPGTGTQIIQSRRVLKTLGSPEINIFFNELGTDIGNLLFDNLNQGIIVNGSAYYLEGPTPITRKTFNYTLVKQGSVNTSFIALTKEDFNETIGSPAFTTSDFITGIYITFCNTINTI